MSFLKILIFKTKLKVLENKQDLYHGLYQEPVLDATLVLSPNPPPPAPLPEGYSLTETGFDQF